ncbi:MAG: DnaD domain protein [Oscillospiraceae bacterium]|nr:DnaD domain protein [Oscillospiraceae bacterium]
MEEKRFHLPDQENHFISGSALAKLLRRADGNATLLYLYILQQHGTLSTAGATEALRLSEQEVADAVCVLASLGLVSGSGVRQAAEQPQEAPRADELPQYSAAEIEQEMTADPAFAALVKEAGGILGKILTAPDLNILMGIYRHLGLPSEVIYQLVSHLTKEHRARYGPGKSPTLRGIEKVAYSWSREDITTLDAAMEHIAHRERRQSELGRLKKVLDIKQDKLTPSQEKNMYAILEKGFDLETIALAYDKTVMATGELKWPYLNKILANWHEKGLRTLEAIETAEPSQKPRGKKHPATTEAAPNRDEIARNRRLLEQMKQK